MKNYKKIFIEALVIIFILATIIYNLIISRDKAEEFEYSDLSQEILVSNSTNTSFGSNESENIEKIKIYITGQVKSSGVIELEYGSRIEDAIILAGGTTDIADLSKVNLAYRLEDGQKIYIPSINDTNVDEYIYTDSGENIIEDTNGNNNSSKKININTASLENLTSIPGIGESTAQKIITYRNENGKFSSIDDLKKVSGIGDKKFEKIKDYIDIH